jgi:hypothetical protein
MMLGVDEPREEHVEGFADGAVDTNLGHLRSRQGLVDLSIVLIGEFVIGSTEGVPSSSPWRSVVGVQALDRRERGRQTLLALVRLKRVASLRSIEIENRRCAVAHQKGRRGGIGVTECGRAFSGARARGPSDDQQYEQERSHEGWSPLYDRNLKKT